MKRCSRLLAERGQKQTVQPPPAATPSRLPSPANRPPTVAICAQNLETPDSARDRPSPRASMAQSPAPWLLSKGGCQAARTVLWRAAFAVGAQYRQSLVARSVSRAFCSAAGPSAIGASAPMSPFGIALDLTSDRSHDSSRLTKTGVVNVPQNVQTVLCTRGMVTSLSAMVACDDLKRHSHINFYMCPSLVGNIISQKCAFAQQPTHSDIPYIPCRSTLK